MGLTLAFAKSLSVEQLVVWLGVLLDLLTILHLNPIKEVLQLPLLLRLRPVLNPVRNYRAVSYIVGNETTVVGPEDFLLHLLDSNRCWTYKVNHVWLQFRLHFGQVALVWDHVGCHEVVDGWVERLVVRGVGGGVVLGLQESLGQQLLLGVVLYAHTVQEALLGQPFFLLFVLLDSSSVGGGTWHLFGGFLVDVVVFSTSFDIRQL